MTDRAALTRSEVLHLGVGRTIASVTEHWARHRPTHPALVWAPFDAEERSWSYIELWNQVATVAAHLAQRGLKVGERVVLLMDNCPEFVVAFLALQDLGAVAVALNTRSASDELRYFIDHADPVGVITQPKFATAVGAVAGTDRWVVVTSTDSGTVPAPGAAPEGESSFDALLEPRRDLDASRDRPAPSPLAPACMQYTSGTTSRPKAVTWSVANCLWAARVNASHEGLDPSDVYLINLPLFHANALAYSLLPSLWSGATVVLQPRFSASRFWDVSLRHRCTWASMVMFTYRALASLEPPTDHHYRRWGNSFSVPAAAHFAGIETIGWFGMTETISHPVCGELHQPNPQGVIGRPAPEYGIRIVDESGAWTAPGEPGELLVRGTPGVSLFSGYAGDPEATAGAFDSDGWFRTGDRVVADDQGFVSYVGRIKDMLKVGGENVAALEIERVLAADPTVAEAAVVGRAHPMLGEVPVAFVTAAPGRSPQPLELIQRCRQHLAEFKVPAAVEVLDELPRATIGKVAKADLRNRAAKTPRADNYAYNREG